MWTYTMEKNVMEDAGIDPATSRMQSARSTIWANPQLVHKSFESSVRNPLKLNYFLSLTAWRKGIVSKRSFPIR